ncbi:uncharacterized protein KY384_001383 [Bacidia gigantensis]|uniref:uncharacterized protein n=1 Tax=Bacidia gigantensis TaxID=2732470 RepID=UPI001D036CEA|nr:uncharacterized protein KY384_001383 [Bacidia gigantensis]KAG8533642.1 hypothetical protein KY384_001383 [Bacidia gigantensis]
MRYYHDQPAYLPTDSQLKITYGIAVTEQITCPKACIPVWPDREAADDGGVADKLYNAWAEKTINEMIFHQNAARETGQTYSAVAQTKLEFDSKKRRTHAKGLYNVMPGFQPQTKRGSDAVDFTNAPYPDNQLAHLVHFPQFQANGQQPRWNVIIHPIPWGCGRHNEAKCMLGHTGVNAPQCPYLLAKRLPRDLEDDRASQLLRDFSPIARGGAVNIPQQGYEMQCTRTAVAKQDRAGNLGLLKLSVPYLNDVFSEHVFPPNPVPRQIWSGSGTATVEAFLPWTYHSNHDPLAPPPPPPPPMMAPVYGPMPGAFQPIGVWYGPGVAPPMW